MFSCSSGPAPEEPVSGQVSQALGMPRRLLPFVQLADGRVLAAGGYDGQRTLSSCEVFDPATGQTRPLTDDQLFRQLPISHRICRVYALSDQHAPQIAAALDQLIGPGGSDDLTNM